MATKDIHMWLIPEFSDGDLVAARAVTGNPELPIVIFVCYYADRNNKEVVHAKLKKLTKLATKKGWPLSISGDFNAHSSLWNAEKPDKRGKIFA